MKFRTSILTVAMGFLLAASAHATSLIRMSLSQLAQASSAIVQAHVISQETRWNRNHTLIMTYTTVQLDKALKGQPASSFTIEQMGGTVGNFHLHVPGTAFLRPQTEYVLFLEPVKGKPETYVPVGMMQGAFRVYQERNGAQKRVVLPLGTLNTGSTSKTLSQSPSLGEFRATVSDVLGTPIVIPAGTSIPLVIESIQFQGTGQAVVTARTASDLFPNKAVVIPAGSRIVGTAQQEGTGWKVYWHYVSIRGKQAHVSGTSKVTGNLKGQSLVVQTR